MEIVKGKRTKRTRPYLGGDAACFPTPSLESEFSDEISVSTEEEEDMANCLILLAQGCYNKQDGEDEDDEAEKVMSKRRLIEIDSIATGRTGYDIYECKTCNRRFPSFQALGGHRASHKKPRAEEKEVKAEKVQGQICQSPPPFPIPVAEVKPALSPLAIKASKVHECSICGSEFSSGQALGGHMRRHRAAPQVKAAGESEEDVSDHKTVNILSFDLNLPAPVEDDQNEVVETMFRFSPKNHLVFAGPTLVGCHY